MMKLIESKLLVLINNAIIFVFLALGYFEYIFI